nr:hypothetical protein [Clostridia bacterium]
MKKIINDIDLSKVKNIIIEDDNVVNFFINEENETLTIMSNVKPEIIDANFNELDKKLSDLEATVKMRILGQLNNLIGKIDKIKIE